MITDKERAAHCKVLIKELKAGNLAVGRKEKIRCELVVTGYPREKMKGLFQ